MRCHTRIVLSRELDAQHDKLVPIIDGRTSTVASIVNNSHRFITPSVHSNFIELCCRGEIFESLEQRSKRKYLISDIPKFPYYTV